MTNTGEGVKPSCENCKYWASYSECRKHAPTYDKDYHFNPRWPLVGRGDWCGDYEQDNSQSERGS